MEETKAASVVRTYEEEMAFIKQETPTRWGVAKGFVKNMRVSRKYFVMIYS